MAKGNRGKGKGKGIKSSTNPNNTRTNNTDNKTEVNDRWAALPETNVRFEKYYRDQGILPDEEWPAFMKALHEPLPTTFRLTGSRPIAASLNKMIEDVYVPFLSGLEYDNIKLSPPQPLSWYPKGYAWQLNIAKQHIRKNEAFRKFQSFLVYETDAGNLSRQEAVSMLPPLLLDIKSNHLVLDMCAAPGSKSAQLLEGLHTNSSTGEEGLVTIPTGCLIANDSDAKRCHMLVHQSLHRIPAASMMVTNHDATQLPGLRLPIPPIEGADPSIRVPKWKAVLYDRILADVPCSGDGTMRKNLMIWRDWSCGNGSGLHALQLRILLRGIALLKPGGRLVYSTCSMNPIENEAVVSAALALSPKMSILDVPELLPTLIRRPGLTTWKVYDSSLNLVPHPSSVPVASTSTSTSTAVEGEEEEIATTTNSNTYQKKKKEKVFGLSQWPNGREKEMGLDKCWRIYPHLQDTGAFFVAVLVKAPEEDDDVVARVKRPAEEAASPPTTSTSDEPEVKRSKLDLVESSAIEVDAEDLEGQEDATPIAEGEEIDLSTLPPDVGGVPVAVTRGIQEFKEEPVMFVDGQDPEIQTCIDFFDLSDAFPRNELLVRNSTGVASRTMYLSSPIIKSLISSNSHSRMRVISCGVKVFSKQDNGKNDDTYPCKWRIMTEGLEIIRPFMGSRRLVKCNMVTLRTLIAGVNIKFEEFVEEQFLNRLKELENGSCILEIVPEDETGTEVTFAVGLTLPLWISKVSVNLMVEKMDKSALSLRIYGEDITPNVKPPSRNLPSSLPAAIVEVKEEVTEGSSSEAAIVAEVVDKIEVDAVVA